MHDEFAPEEFLRNGEPDEETEDMGAVEELEDEETEGDLGLSDDEEL